MLTSGTKGLRIPLCRDMHWPLRGPICLPFFFWTRRSDAVTKLGYNQQQSQGQRRDANATAVRSHRWQQHSGRCELDARFLHCGLSQGRNDVVSCTNMGFRCAFSNTCDAMNLNWLLSLLICDYMYVPHSFTHMHVLLCLSSLLVWRSGS